MTQETPLTDVTQAADIEGINAAIGRVRDHVAVLPDNTGDEAILLAEYDRMRDKLDAFTHGETVLIMNDADRAKAALDLDDATFAKWGRGVLMNLDRLQAGRTDAEAEDRPVQKLIAMHGVITLALAAHNANAGEIKFAVSGVTYQGVDKGDWEVIVRRAGPTDAEEALHLFREFYQRNVTQCADASVNHAIWSMVAEALDNANLNHKHVHTGPEWVFVQPGNTRSLDDLRKDAEASDDGR